MPPPEERELERLRRELATARADLGRLERGTEELRARASTLEARLSDAETGRTKAESANAAMKERLQEIQATLRDTQAMAARGQDELRRLEGELGRLRAIAETVEPLRQERDRLVADIAQVKADAESRVAEEVKAALDRAAVERQAAAAQWAKEKDELSHQIEALRKQLESGGVTGRVSPSDLASKFAAVLDQLAEGTPTAGRSYAAALTGLEVEARGVLEAPRDGEDEPRLVTVDAGKVDPAALSTVRMTFRLLPRIGEKATG